MVSSRDMILLTGADNGRYLSTLADAFQRRGFRVIRLYVRLPTTGIRPARTTSSLFETTIRFILRKVYGSPLARRTGSWILSAIATCALRLLEARILLTIVNSPQLSHKPVFLAAQDGNVRVISAFHGSDVRPPYLNGLLSLGSSPSEIYSRTRVLKETVALVESFSYRVITWSKIGHFLEFPYICHELIGFPTNVLVDSYPSSQSVSHTPPLGHREFKILHAPSSHGKGTDEIVAAVEKLQLQGINVSLSVVRDLATLELFEKIKDHDLVIDQIYADSAPSVLAMECLILGCPVLMAGWSIAETSAEFKIVNGLSVFHPENLETVLAQLITDTSAYQDLRQKQTMLARHLAAEWNSDNVANRILQLLDNPNLTAIWGVPSPPGFAAGGFGPPEQIRNTLRKYIYEFGTEALFLEKNSRLHEMISDWAEY